MSNPLHKALGKIMPRTMRAVQQSCVDLSDDIADGSPVDTGSFVASWVAGKGELFSDNVNVASGGQPRKAQFKSVAYSMKPGDYYSFCNGQPYGPLLEYDGWSSQAPNGFVGINVARFDSILGSNARAVRDS